MLISQDLTVGAISRKVNISMALASKHLKVLLRSQLIEQFKCGRTTISKLNFGTLSDANVWLNSLGLLDVLDISGLERFLSEQEVIKS